MKKRNTLTIGEAIKEYLQAMRIDGKLKEVRLINSWEEVMGKSIAKVTRKIYINNSILFVLLSSAVVRSELLMLKTGIIKAMNDKAGEKIIDDIVFR